MPNGNSDSTTVTSNTCGYTGMNELLTVSLSLRCVILTKSVSCQRTFPATSMATVKLSSEPTVSSRVRAKRPNVNEIFRKDM